MIKRILCSIFELLKGILTVFKHAFMKPVTLEYPEVKPEHTERFRGKPVFDKEKCIACGICQKVCPAFAIEIDKNSENKLERYKIDLNRCILCGNCMYNCPTGAIKLSGEFELATDDKNDLALETTILKDRKTASSEANEDL